MELKVSVEGVERSVAGINETTTCAQIIYALAYATSQKGKFAMVERFRNVERRLSPNDRPLETLQKWREQASSVTFILKRIDDADLSSNSTINSNNMLEDIQGRQTSSSSVASAFPGTMNHSPGRFENANRSTSSLPAYHGSTTPINRPPPPDYKTVMEQKFASMSRGTQQRPSVLSQNGDSTIARLRLSHNDLLELIEKQRRTIEEQKTRLVQSELCLPSNSDRELLQLGNQQENLRSILEPLREAKWPNHYQAEVKKSHKLRAAIEATKEALDKNAVDLMQLANDEQRLLEEIARMTEDETVENELVSFTKMNIDSSKKLSAC